VAARWAIRQEAALLPYAECADVPSRIELATGTSHCKLEWIAKEEKKNAPHIRTGVLLVRQLGCGGYQGLCHLF